MRDSNIEPLTTKVTTINGRYHCRIMKGDVVHDESACELKEDVRLIIREMLRWYDKMGFSPYSKMADAARHRGKNYEKPKGKVWRNLDGWNKIE